MTQTRGGAVLDEATFGPLTEALRRDLLVHCYRFCGSVTEAEDLVQETLTRAWRARQGFRGEAGLRTWLRSIATRVCIDAQRARRGRRTLPAEADGPQSREPLWLDPLPDHLLADLDADPAQRYDLRESVSLAFLAALQRLPARQRAVLILRDVLVLSAAEVAAQLEISEGAVTSLLHRARTAMRANGGGRGPTRPPDAETATLLRSYLRAWEAGDVHALLALLRRDATVEMPPVPFAPRGHDAIAAFFSDGILDGTRGRWHGIVTAANGAPATAMYERTDDGYRFIGVHLLAFEDGAISLVTAFMDPSLASRFGLPELLPADAVRDA